MSFILVSIKNLLVVTTTIPFFVYWLRNIHQSNLVVLDLLPKLQNSLQRLLQLNIQTEFSQ